MRTEDFKVIMPEPAERPGYTGTALPAESLGFEVAGEDKKYVPRQWKSTATRSVSPPEKWRSPGMQGIFGPITGTWRFTELTAFRLPLFGRTGGTALCP